MRMKYNEAKGTEELYNIAFQLLEAQDEVLLNLAVECLLRIRNYEVIHGARVVELHSHFSYAQGNRAKIMSKKLHHIPSSPSTRE